MEGKSVFFDSPGFRRLTPWALYFVSLALGVSILLNGASMGLFPMPQPGMDQLSMLQAAVGIAQGHLPAPGYMYSSAYTLFLAALVKICQGDLFLMRVLQCALCSLIPVLVYKLGLKLRFGREAALAGAVLYILYGPAQLIALDFLREAPLGLCFIAMLCFAADATLKRSPWRFALAGLFAGLCVLGRENFIPVVFAPALLLFNGSLRKRIGWKGPVLALAAACILLAATVGFSGGRFGGFLLKPLYAIGLAGYYHSAPNAPISAAFSNIPTQFWNFLSSYEMPNSLSFYAHRELIETLSWLAIPFNALCVLSIMACALCCKRRGVLLIVPPLAVYAATLLPFLVFYRYRIPAVPLFAVLAGFGLIHFFKGETPLKWRVAIGVCALALFFATWQNPDKLRTPQERAAVVDILVFKQRFEKAESLIEKMKRDGLDVSRLDRNLAAARAAGLRERL